GPVALDDGDVVGGIRLLHEQAEVEPGRAAPDRDDPHRLDSKACRRASGAAPLFCACSLRAIRGTGRIWWPWRTLARGVAARACSSPAPSWRSSRRRRPTSSTISSSLSTSRTSARSPPTASARVRSRPTPARAQGLSAEEAQALREEIRRLNERLNRLEQAGQPRVAPAAVVPPAVVTPAVAAPPTAPASSISAQVTAPAEKEIELRDNIL